MVKQWLGNERWFVDNTVDGSEIRLTTWDGAETRGK